MGDVAFTAVVDGVSLMQPLTTKLIDVAGRQIRLQLPENPEQLLSQSGGNTESLDPYWAILWTAAVHTARCVLANQWPRSASALEIGCGAGLVGIAGLMAGLQVTFNDVVDDAVKLAVSNAELNGFADIPGIVSDWNSHTNLRCHVLLASDILYEASQHDAVLTFADQCLLSGGVFWIGDPGRQHATSFVKDAARKGWAVHLKNERLETQDAPIVGSFQLIQLTR